jgi:nicotinate-nucleotide adenylyltransferase
VNELRVPRIGLLGGSFDPPHRAHLALARTALEHLALDEVRWLPAGLAWQKTRRAAPAAHRRAMVALAIEGEPRFVLDDRELRRAGPSYTSDTLRELHAERAAEWFLVIGQDQYANLHTWHEWEALLPLATLAVASRGGEAPSPDPALAGRAHRVAVLPLPRLDVSSTEIRRRVAAGEDIRDMVPTAVASYIDRHHLYRDRSGS